MNIKIICQSGNTIELNNVTAIRELLPNNHFKDIDITKINEFTVHNAPYMFISSDKTIIVSSIHWESIEFNNIN